MSVQTKYLLKKELTSAKSEKTLYSYYPFGMPMPNRQYSLSSGSKYRFGFNGKEDDKEIDGQQDYGLRIYDNRLGRFKSVDPLFRDFPWNSPYSFAENTPIQAIDLEGAEKYVVIHYSDALNCGWSKIKMVTMRDAAGNLIDQQVSKMGGKKKVVKDGEDVLNIYYRNGNMTYKGSTTLTSFQNSLLNQTVNAGLRDNIGYPPLLHTNVNVNQLDKSEFSAVFQNQPVEKLNGNFNFEGGTDNLVGDNSEMFQNIANYLENNSCSKITISGATPNQGKNPNSKRSNYTVNGNGGNSLNELLAGRAEKIKSILVNDYGVDADRIGIGTPKYNQKDDKGEARFAADIEVKNVKK